MTETFYDVLGVAESATTEEIEAAYRERLKHVHPDVNDDADAGESTRDLIEARDVLVDEAERARYDRIGHDAYVGNDSGTTGSDVAATARRAGYGTSRPGETTTATSNARDAQKRARERRQRERRASERVREDRRERASDQHSSTADASGEHGSRTDPSGPSGASQTGSGTSTGTTPGGMGPSWNSGGYTVSDPDMWYQSADGWVPTGRDLTLLGIVFSLYPVLLFSALVPAFPLFVNLTLGGCLVLVVGYLQSMPRIALLVFGPWSIVMPFVVLGLGLSLVSLVGIAVILATWLPLGLTVLTISVLQL